VANEAITSRALKLAALPSEKKREILEALSAEESEILQFCWEFWARPNQLLPVNCSCHGGMWRTWLILAGRGFGKTRSGAEAARKWAEEASTEYITFAASKALDIRDVMVEGESGILAISPNNFRPKYEPSKRRLTWPNGVKALLLSADEPDTFRGPQHGKAWADELAKWPYPEAWDQMMFGLRLGVNPQVVVTTTPRPTKLIKDLMMKASTHVTRGTTYENRANLAKAFYEEICAAYEGTRLGRQELHAEILDDNPGALWKREWFDTMRVVRHPKLRRIGIGVDPAVTSKETSDETGIVGAGVGECRCKGMDKPEMHGFVLSDESGIYSPDGWAKKTVQVFDTLQANKVIAEINKGGDLVTANIRTVRPSIPIDTVRASRGKDIRAEPVAALYEQRKIHHVGSFPQLEDQCCDWNPLMSSDSPDRLDALVWVMFFLMVGAMRPVYESSSEYASTKRRM
jgi:phage terminase large subunit-like protein